MLEHAQALGDAVNDSLQRYQSVGSSLSRQIAEAAESQSGGLSHSVAAIEAAIAEAAGTVAAHDATIRQTLTEHANALSNAVDESLVRHQGLGSALSAQIADAAERQSGDLSKSVAAMEAVIAEAGAAVAAQEAAIRQTMSGHVQGLTGAVNESLDRFQTVGSSLSQQIADVAGRQSDGLSKSVESIEAAIAEAGGVVAAHETAIRRSLLENVQSFARAVSEGLERFHSVANLVSQRIAESVDKQSQSLADGVETINAAISEAGAAGATHESQIQQALSDHARRLSEIVNAGLSQLELAGGQSSTQLLGQVDERVRAMSAHASALHAAIEANQTALEQSVAEHQAAMERSAAEHRAATEQAFGDGFAKLDAASAKAGENWFERIDAVSGGLSSRLEGILSSFERLLTVGADELDARLSRRNDEAAELIDTKSRLLDGRTSARLNELSTTLDALIGRIEGGLDSRQKSLQETMASGTLQAAKTLNDGSKNLFIGLQTGVDAALGALTQRADAMSATLTDLAGSIDRYMAKGTNDVARVFETNLSQLRDQVVAPLEAGAARLDGVRAEFAARASDHVQSLGELFDGHAKAIDGAVVTHIDTVHGRLEQGASILSAGVAERIGVLTQTLQEAQSRLEIQNTALNQLLGEHARALDASFEDNARAIDGRLNLGATSIGAQFTANNAMLDASLEQLEQRLLGDIAARSDTITRSVADQVTAMHNVVGGDGQLLLEKLAEMVARLKSSFDGQTRDLVGLIGRRGEDLQAAIAASASTSARSLGELTNQLAQDIERAIQQLQGAAEAARTQSTAFTEQVATDADRSVAALQSASELARGQTRLAIEEMTEGVTRALAALAAAGQNAQTQGDEAASRAIQRLNSELVRSTAALTAATESALSRGGEASTRLVGDVADQVSQSIAALEDALEKARSHGSDAAQRLVGQIADEVDRKHAEMRASVDLSATRLTSAFNEAGDQAHSKLAPLLEKLGSTNAELAQLNAVMDENLNNLHSEVAGRLGEFQRALGSLSGQVAALGRVSNTTQTEATALADKLDQRTRALAEIADGLAATQTMVDATLAGRQERLAALLDNLTASSGSFDVLLKRFADTVEDSFAKGQARAQEINAMLAATSKSSTLAIGGQFNAIQEAANRESSRASATLQRAYEQANAQLTETVDKSLERFRQTAEEVKTLSAEIRRELETTREDLRHGVIALPQEVEEATESVRRVVSDQIAALKELTDAVANSEVAFDVVQTPTPRAPERMALERIAPASPPPRAFSAPIPPAAAAPRAERPEPEPRAARPLAPPAPEPILPREPIIARDPMLGREPANLPGRDKGGWLTSLLAAASREEAEPSQPELPATDALNAVAQNASRLLDGDAVVDFWDRRQNGEIIPPTRRLYTAQGQETFDSVRRRMRSDATFRAASDRYVQEFERLIARVGSNDPDGSRARSYLLSDTGKVYTLLAHAAGLLN